MKRGSMSQIIEVSLGAGKERTWIYGTDALDGAQHC